MLTKPLPHPGPPPTATVDLSGKPTETRKVCSAGVHAALHLVEGPRASPTSSTCLADEFGGHARSDIVTNSQMIGSGLDPVGERKVGGTGT